MFKKRRLSVMLGLALALPLAGVALPAAAQHQAPAGYPAAYQQVIDGARKEGRLVIYSATDTRAAEPLIRDFNVLYPGIRVEYNDLNSTEAYNRFISEAAAGGATADLMWSSSMDLQMKLVTEGYALDYASPEAGALPDWAIWQNTAYGTTYEPTAIVYNKRRVTEDEVPRTHDAFITLLTEKRAKFRNRVTTYDIEKSGVGFSLISHDLKVNPRFWEVARALGGVAVRVQSSTGTMLERLSSGENLIGYNVLGPYALMRIKRDPSLGVVFTEDYNLVLSRVMFINKAARHPNAAKLWLDYILSKRGQTIVANDAQLFAIRADVQGETTYASLHRQLGDALRPLPVSPEITEYLDPAKRLDFLRQWRQATRGR